MEWFIVAGLLFLGVWFGLRGVGSLYYLAFAIAGGLAAGVWQPILDATLIAVTASVIVHGLSVTPLLHWRERRARRSGQ